MQKYSLFLKSVIFFAPVVVLTCACTTTTTKDFIISGSNKRQGIIELSFDYSARQTPEIKAEQPHDLALAQCKQWGYTTATQSEPLTDGCVALQNAKCLRNRAVIKFQCQ